MVILLFRVLVLSSFFLFMQYQRTSSDSFTGFQEGGEFLAIVSIKVKDKNQTENIKAE